VAQVVPNMPCDNPRVLDASMTTRQRKGQTMAIAMFSEWSQAPTDASQRVAESINRRLENTFPAGGLYHAEGPNDDGGW